jgi:hypothetical protein
MPVHETAPDQFGSLVAPIALYRDAMLSLRPWSAGCPRIFSADMLHCILRERVACRAISFLRWGVATLLASGALLATSVMAQEHGTGHT